MGDNNQVKWTEDQWARVRQAVHEEATRARVAASFLPQFGPLPSETVTVPVPKMLYQAEWPSERGEVESRIEVSDYDTKPLISIAVEVFLTTAQMADPNLSSAMTLFRRAANVIARVEDWIVFRGKGKVYHPWHLDPSLQDSLAAVTNLQKSIDAVKQPGAAKAAQDAVDALTGAIQKINDAIIKSPNDANGNPIVPNATPNIELSINVNPRIFVVKPADWQYDGLADTELLQGVGTGASGEDLVKAVVAAIGTLEENGHLGPFVCVLGQKLFTTANTPNGSLVLPSDRITPFLNGPLLRCGVLDGLIYDAQGKPQADPKGAFGVVVSLAGAPTELVVAQDLSVNFLQVNDEPRGVFRVSERILLRIKERRAVVKLVLGPVVSLGGERSADALTSPVKAGPEGGSGPPIPI